MRQDHADQIWVLRGGGERETDIPVKIGSSDQGGQKHCFCGFHNAKVGFGCPIPNFLSAICKDVCREIRRRLNYCI